MAHKIKHPISLVPIGGNLGAEIARFINIYTTGYYEEHETPPRPSMMRVTNTMQTQGWNKQKLEKVERIGKTPCT